MQFRKLFKPIIEAGQERIKRNPDEEPSNFMQAYLAEMERRKEKGENMDSYRHIYPLVDFNEFANLSLWQLYAALGDLWGAGVETTATTLEWALLLLCKSPEVQKRV